MSRRWLARYRSGSSLGIIFLILGLVHAPLPQPDFHNIRHHDDTGEVCEFHDHLLRWHPSAGGAADVAVLHWHWVLPAVEPFDPPAEGSIPAIHANVVDWQASTWEDGPRATLDTTPRYVSIAKAAPICSLPGHPVHAARVVHPPNSRRIRTFGATFAHAAPLVCLSQRWDC